MNEVNAKSKAKMANQIGATGPIAKAIDLLKKEPAATNAILHVTCERTLLSLMEV